MQVTTTAMEGTILSVIEASNGTVLAGTAVGAATVTVTFVNAAKSLVKQTAVVNGAFSVELSAAELSGLGEGYVRYSAVATDFDGNVGAPSATGQYFYTTQPLVDSEHRIDLGANAALLGDDDEGGIGVTQLSDGGFVVRWLVPEANTPAGDDVEVGSIAFQRYRADGQEIGDTIVLTGIAPLLDEDDEVSAAVTALENGGYALAYSVQFEHGNRGYGGTGPSGGPTPGVLNFGLIGEPQVIQINQAPAGATYALVGREKNTTNTITVNLPLPTNGHIDVPQALLDQFAFDSRLTLRVSNVTSQVVNLSVTTGIDQSVDVDAALISTTLNQTAAANGSVFVGAPGRVEIIDINQFSAGAGAVTYTLNVSAANPFVIDLSGTGFTLGANSLLTASVTPDANGIIAVSPLLLERLGDMDVQISLAILGAAANSAFSAEVSARPYQAEVEGVFVQQFGADGAALGPPSARLDAALPVGIDDNAAVGISPVAGGGFVAHWVTLDGGFAVQRFDASGQQVGGAVELQSATGVGEDDPAFDLVALSGGGYALVAGIEHQEAYHTASATAANANPLTFAIVGSPQDIYVNAAPGGASYELGGINNAGTDPIRVPISVSNGRLVIDQAVLDNFSIDNRFTLYVSGVPVGQSVNLGILTEIDQTIDTTVSLTANRTITVTAGVTPAYPSPGRATSFHIDQATSNGSAVTYTVLITPAFGTGSVNITGVPNSTVISSGSIVLFNQVPDASGNIVIPMQILNQLDTDDVLMTLVANNLAIGSTFSSTVTYNPSVTENVGVLVETFDATGNLLSGPNARIDGGFEAQIDDGTVGATAVPDGGFVIHWLIEGENDETEGVAVQRFHADGSKDGGVIVLQGLPEIEGGDVSYDFVALANGGYNLSYGVALQTEYYTVILTSNAANQSYSVPVTGRASFIAVNNLGNIGDTPTFSLLGFGLDGQRLTVPLTLANGGLTIDDAVLAQFSIENRFSLLVGGVDAGESYGLEINVLDDVLYAEDAPTFTETRSVTVTTNPNGGPSVGFVAPPVGRAEAFHIDAKTTVGGTNPTYVLNIAPAAGGQWVDLTGVAGASHLPTGAIQIVTGPDANGNIFVPQSILNQLGSMDAAVSLFVLGLQVGSTLTVTATLEEGYDAPQGVFVLTFGPDGVVLDQGLDLIGDNGNDVLVGDVGDDFLSAAGGINTLTGGAGADVFHFDTNAGGSDTITDFSDDDLIDFQAIDGANQFLGMGAFTGVAGQYRYYFADGQTRVAADTDGNGSADWTLTIANGYFNLVETTAGSNQLQAGPANPITGTSTNNTLNTTMLNDVVDALGGNDTINASQGHDLVNGGAGFDRLVINMSSASRFQQGQSSARTYVITGSSIVSDAGELRTDFSGIESISLSLSATGDNNDDVDAAAWTGTGGYTLNHGNNHLIGGSGNDTVTTGRGIDLIEVGLGFDTVIVTDAVGATTFVLTGDDMGAFVTQNGTVTTTIRGAEQISLGTTLNSQLNDGLTHTLDASGYTGAGLVILRDHNGTDVMTGSHGSDIFANTAGNTLGGDTYLGNGGADIFDYTFAVSDLNGDIILDLDRDDIIDFQYNTPTNNTGGNLAHLFIGSAAFSNVAGQYRYFVSGGQTFVQNDNNGDGVADRTLTIANGQFVLAETTAGSNQLKIAGLIGTAGVDTLTGTLGNDQLYGEGGNDILNGSQGTDFVDGGAGAADRLHMLTGTASLFTLATGARSYTIGANTITDSSGTLNTTFTNVERINFSTVGNGNFNDTIDASGFSSPHEFGLDIRLGNGNNTVTGSAANDRVFTGFGGNTLTGGPGGYDIAFVTADASSAVTIVVTNDSGTLVTNANGVINRVTGFEEVAVSATGTGTVTLNASTYTAVPGTLIYLVGHNGSDIMLGSAGVDLFANITGQVLGNDTYTGNGGADIYDYTYAADSMNGDVITDFDIDDVIDLRFNNLEAGGSPVLANHFIGAAAFSGVAGEYRYQISGTTTVVQVDSNGDKSVDQTLTITNGGFALAETVAGSNLLTLAAVINPLDGVVADGYVAGATLFVDVNGNGVLDTGEAWTTTDADGNFTLNVNQAGAIVAVGGTNKDTGLANQMVLKSAFDAPVVNPLTTLIAAVMASEGLSIADAETAVKDALGLDTTLNLLTTDLLNPNGGAAALKAQKAAALIVNLVTTAETVPGATGGTEAATLNVLAGLVTNGPVDLTNAGTLNVVLDTALGTDVPAAVVNQLATEAAVINAATSVSGVSAAQLAAALSGDDLDNAISGTSRNDDFRVQQGGNDTLNGLDGNDLFYFGAAFNAADTVNGGVGRDAVILQGNYNITLGSAGATSFVGVEQLVLMPGNDTSYGDTGGSLYDYLLFMTDAALTAGQVLTIEAAALRAGEDVTLSASGETNGAFVVHAGAGNDLLIGGAGNDILNGGGGHDDLRGGSGTNILNGFDGDDILRVSGTGDAANGGSGTDKMIVSVSTSLGALSEVEAIELGGGAVLTLTGAQAAGGLPLDAAISGSGGIVINMTSGVLAATKLWSFSGSIAMTLNGTAGSDIMKLGDFSHTVNGGDAADQIKGGSASDTLRADGGGDKINGGGGGDMLTGGAGNDVFKYARPTDSGTGAGTSDIITDFTIGQDRLNFAKIDANAAAAGDQAFAFIGTAAFANTGSGQIRYGTSGSDWLVQADVDGNGVADMAIVLQGLAGQPLTGADFVL